MVSTVALSTMLAELLISPFDVHNDGLQAGVHFFFFSFYSFVPLKNADVDGVKYNVTVKFSHIYLPE